MEAKMKKTLDEGKKPKVATIKEVIFCQEILKQYCYKIEHIPILNLKKCEFNQISKSQKSIEEPKENKMDSSENLFSCLLCSGTFRYGSHLRKHQGIHNEEKIFQESQMLKIKKKIQISDNPKNFTITKLRGKLDLSEKLFSCQLCSGTFRYGSHLRKHQGVHNGKKLILGTKNTWKPQPYETLSAGTI